MNLGLNGYLNGLSALGVLIVNIIIGIYIMYKAIKLDAKLLKYSAVMIILIGFLWSGPSLDFVTILLTQYNIPYDIRVLYVYASYVWVAPAIFLATIIGAELIAPDKKKYILGFILIVSIVFEIGVIAFPLLSYDYPEPYPTGQNLIDTSLNYGFFTFYALLIIIVTIVLFNGIGAILKARDSSGILRKKFLFLSLGFILFPIAAVFDTLIPPGPFLPIVRLLVILSAILLYL
ncbi:MAG: hypothetical protein EU549_04835, partial [Promethearchaeota archaeon]